MTKAINELFMCKEGGELSFELCQQINMDLSKIKLEDIPEDQQENVQDYLLNALNMNSVRSDLVPKLEFLLASLQESK